MADGLPQFLTTTYETARADAVEVDFGDVLDGPLTAALRGRRTLVVYDESSKLAETRSALYRAHKHVLEVLGDGVRIAGLTATPLTRNWDSVYAQFRLVCPQVLPTPAEFEAKCVIWRDSFGKAQFNEAAIAELLLEPIAPYLLRRRKTDPGVCELFPVTRERVVHAAMTPVQQQLYAGIEAIGHDSEQEIPGLLTVLRMIAGYPAALVGSDSQLAKDIVASFGADWLRSIRPGKLDALLAVLGPVVERGEKAVVFSFFGPTILPLLAADLAHLGARVFLHYGEMTLKARSKAIEEFRAFDGPALLLTSDSGRRGINLPEARTVVEYDGALTYEGHTQRINRIHRLDSPFDTVEAVTIIADRTVEEPIAAGMLKRNEDTELLLGDGDAEGRYLSAAERRAMMRLWSSEADAA